MYHTFDSFVARSNKFSRNRSLYFICALPNLLIYMYVCMYVCIYIYTYDVIVFMMKKILGKYGRFYLC